MGLKRGVTLEALEVLDSIDKQGSFASAAQSLFKVPSALTYTIKKLEEDLGVQLFQKDGRQSVLTPAGKVLLEQGRELLAAADRLQDLVQRVDSGWESRLNIAVDTVLPMSCFYNMVLDFYNYKPDIEINFFEVVLAGAWEVVLDGEVDMVIGAADPQQLSKSLLHFPIGQVEWILAVAPHHELVSLSKKQIISRDDLADYRAVVVRDSSKHTAPLSRRIFTDLPVFSVPTIEEKIEAQKQGVGIGFLPRFRIQPLLENGTLVEIPIEGKMETHQMFVGCKKQHKGRAMHWFLEQIRKTNYPFL